MNDGPRLYYLDDIPTPYRLGVHQRIAELWPGRFRLAFCAASEPGRTWDLDLGMLDTEILPGFQYRPPRQANPMSVKFNPLVWRSLDAFRPDVVAVSGYVHPTIHLAAAWCRMHRVPYGVSCETSRRDTVMGGLKARLKKRIASSVVRGMAFGLPVGRDAAQYLELLGAKGAPMFHFPNTPNAAAIAAAAEQTRRSGAEQTLRQAFAIPPTSRIILFVGRMIDAKRPMDLLQAFGGLDSDTLDAALVFVGGGPLLEGLRQRAAGLARVVFTDWVKEPERVFELMAISSVFALPSQHEPWGAVVNEAMASGVPVIASDRVGAAMELVDSGTNGLVVPVGDVRGFATAIESLLADEAHRARLGRAGQATALAHGHEFAAGNLVKGAGYAVNVRRKGSSNSPEIIESKADLCRR